MEKQWLYIGELVKASLENRVPDKLSEELSIKELATFAWKQHMMCILLKPLLKLELSAEDDNYIRKYILQDIITSSKQLAELKKIEKLFEEEKIINQPMKGACMKYIYPTPELRFMGDIDILVEEEKKDKVGKLLLDRGYELVSEDYHHDVYVKEQHIRIEVHKVMYSGEVDEKQEEYFSDFSRSVLKEGCKYTYKFSEEDFYVYMVAHAAKHFYIKGCGIRHLVDIYVYNQYFQEMDRKYIKEELTKCGLISFEKHISKLSKIWLDGEKSDSFYDSLFEYMCDSGIDGKEENGVWHRFIREDNNVDDFKKWYIFPPYSYMVELYPWLEKTPFLLPVAWIVRGYNGVFFKRHRKKVDKNTVKNMTDIYRKMDLNFKVKE